ncbi:ArnT family glycosyltransferase [Pseudarthrobacter siccitolerans]
MTTGFSRNNWTAWWSHHWDEVIILTVSGLVYFWDLSINGWGNPYYAAAAQAGASDWNAFLFGSGDAGNGLSVDKPPLHLWVLALSVKAFGLSSMAVLAPQALMGMTSACLIQRISRVWGSRMQGLCAGLFVVLTPVTSMIFRFNNPDALLLLLWALTAYLVVKSVERQSIVLLNVGAFVLGLAFLCKQFQSWILAPAVILALLFFGFGKLRRRLRYLTVAAIVMIGPAATWILAVELTPESHRPWIGGSVSNSVLELTFGYNGLGRLTGQTELGAVNPKDFEGVVGSDASLLRLLTINYAPEIAWFLPVAFIGGALLLLDVLRGKLTNLQSMVAVLSLTWFVTTFTVLSFMTGDIHPYYTSMIALPLSILSAHAFIEFWKNRRRRAYLRGAAFLLLVCIFISSGILTWFQSWHQWPGVVTKVAALGVAAALFLPGVGRRPRAVNIALCIAGVTITLIPSLFILESISTPQQGSFPISGPVPSAESWHKRDAQQLILDEREKYALARGEPVVPGIAERIAGASTSARWAAVTTGSENAALYQLTAQRPVLAIGGFSAIDVYPSLSTFQHYVAGGQIAYYIHKPGILEWSSGENTSAVVSWIENNFGFEEIDGVRLYDMTRKIG